MTPLRLALVTPRYWPLCGETEQYAADLVQQIRDWGVRSVVVTARWGSEWPRQMVHRETPAVRLSHAPLGGWATFRYLRALGNWLRDHQRELDLVYVMNLRQDALAVLGALPRQPAAVVLRVRPEDATWLGSSLRGTRLLRRAAQIGAFVAGTEAIQRESLTAGFPPRKLHVIRNVVRLLEPSSPAARHAARAALAAANQMLAVAEYAPVAVTVGPLLDGRRLSDLIDSWRLVVARWPSARLWIFGDGPLRETLFERIVDRGLHNHVAMPGTFDDLSDVLPAADVFLAPARPTDGGHHLLEAMTAALGIVAVDCTDHREFVEHGQSGLLVPPGDHAAMAKAAGEFIESPQQAAAMGHAARRRVQSICHPHHMVEEHLQLFQQVVAGVRS